MSILLYLSSYITQIIISFCEAREKYLLLSQLPNKYKHLYYNKIKATNFQAMHSITTKSNVDYIDLTGIDYKIQYKRKFDQFSVVYKSNNITYWYCYAQ